MKKLLLNVLLLAVLVWSCHSDKAEQTFKETLKDSSWIAGTASYLGSPYVTAGNRVYMVGHQDGSFPEIGWHIKGEMGGIWDHPIKLMDGFEASLILNDESFELDEATSFINYPMANSHFYSWDDNDLKIERTQFVPDDKQGIAVQYVIKNSGENFENFIFRFTGHSDLMPTWLGDKTKMHDGPDQAEFDEKRGYWVVKDSLNPWFVVYGAMKKPTSHNQVKNNYSGLGVSNTLEYQINLKSGEKSVLTFSIAGSYQSKKDAISEFQQLNNETTRLLNEKMIRYQALSRNSKLTIPDENMQEAFEWLKYNCDWLIRDVPEVGTGIMAGIPDYPWWFGVDSEYALKGYMAIGQEEVVYKTIELLDSISNMVNGNGRIVHEVSTNGYVFNPGNINETPQFSSLIWEVYRWNGDKEFLKKYFPTIQKGLNWLMTENDKDGNLFPEGFGMMEIHGLDSEMIDVASYTQRAFEDASKIANELGRENLSVEYSLLASEIKKEINSKFWSEEFGSYADFIGTDEQALHLIEDAIVRADTLNKPWAVQELKDTKKMILANPSPLPKPFVVHHNWVVNTPMEMGIADPEKARIALVTAEQFVNPFGVFVTGIDRDASAGSDDGTFKGSKVFSYTGAVMTLPTGVQAVAENNYNRSDEALNYLERMTRTFSFAFPGSIYEVSPDYGMMTQAWNIYSFAVPIVHQFFGIQPDAAHKKVIIRPSIPKKWDKASLEHVKVVNNEVSVFYSSDAHGITIRIEQTDPSWELILEPTENQDTEFEIVTKTERIIVAKADSRSH